MVITISRTKNCYWLWKERRVGPAEQVWPADATQLVTYLDPSTSTVLLLRSRRGAIEDELHDSHLRDTKYRTNQQVLLC